MKGACVITVSEIGDGLQHPLGDPAVAGFLLGSMTHPGLQNAGDISLTAGLITSPAWATWLADINLALTTFTLVVGLIIGLARLWVLWRDRGKR